MIGRKERPELVRQLRDLDDDMRTLGEALADQQRKYAKEQQRPKWRSKEPSARPAMFGSSAQDDDKWEWAVDPRTGYKMLVPKMRSSEQPKKSGKSDETKSKSPKPVNQDLGNGMRYEIEIEEM